MLYSPVNYIDIIFIPFTGLIVSDSNPSFALVRISTSLRIFSPAEASFKVAMELHLLSRSPEQVCKYQKYHPFTFAKSNIRNGLDLTDTYLTSRITLLIENLRIPSTQEFIFNTRFLAVHAMYCD